MLEVALALKLGDDDLSNPKIVRAKVKDLTKLGELKWRYRVVEEGQNPRDEAIKVEPRSCSLYAVAQQSVL